MSRFLTSLLILAVLSCNSQQPTTSDYVTFKLKKTPCYGDCPVFELNVYDNKTVELIADQNLSLKGQYLSKLSEDKYNTLVMEFKNSNFFEFEDIYTSNRSDFPTTYVTFNDGDKEKTIQDYDNAPKTLKELESKLEKLIEELDWQKVQE